MSLDGDLETRLNDAFDGGGDDGDDEDDDGGDGDLETSLDDGGTWGKLGVF